MQSPYVLPPNCSRWHMQRASCSGLYCTSTSSPYDLWPHTLTLLLHIPPSHHRRSSTLPSPTVGRTLKSLLQVIYNAHAHDCWATCSCDSACRCASLLRAVHAYRCASNCCGLAAAGVVVVCPYMHALLTTPFASPLLCALCCCCRCCGCCGSPCSVQQRLPHKLHKSVHQHARLLPASNRRTGAGHLRQRGW